MKILRMIVLVILLSVITNSKMSPVPFVAETSLTGEPVQIKQVDQRTKILAAYFQKYNSPLQYQAGDFIDAADTYGVDWKLVPAISGVESTFGKNSYGYNAWGWGIYGDQRLNFSSWRRGIFTVTEGLKTKYINDGLIEPLAMNKRYAASPTWGVRVNYFIKDIEKFEASQPNSGAPKESPLTKIAASSAQLALKN